MTIREATLEDAETVVDLIFAFLDATAYGELLGYHSEALETLLATVLTSGVVYLAEVDGRAIGILAIAAMPHPMTGDPYAEELAWWVDPAYRSGSIGPRLLRAGEDWATQNGCHVLKMVAPAGSTVGRYYEQTGYSPVETSYIKRLRSPDGRILDARADRTGRRRRRSAGAQDGEAGPGRAGADRPDGRARADRDDAGRSQAPGRAEGDE